MRAFVGYGELGVQVDTLLQAAAGHADAVYFDDNAYREGVRSSAAFGDYGEAQYAEYDFYVCLGYRHLPTKRQILGHLRTLNRRLPAFVHASVYASDSARIGAGCIVYPGALIDKGVRLDDGVLVNNAVTISHDSVIGESCYLSPGVTICGKVRIGAASFLGAGVVVSDGVSIGEGVTVGIGSVVTRDLPPGVSAIGNPIRILDGQLSI